MRKSLVARASRLLARTLADAFRGAAQKRFEERRKEQLANDEILKDKLRSRPFPGDFQGLDSDRDHPINFFSSTAQKCQGLKKVLNEIAGPTDTHFNMMVLPMFEHSARLLGSTGEATSQSGTRERDTLVRQLAEDLCNTYVFNMEPEQYDELWSKKGKAAGGQQTLLPPTQITLRLFDDRTGDDGIEYHLNEMIEKGECYMGQLLNLSRCQPDCRKEIGGEYLRRRGAGEQAGDRSLGTDWGSMNDEILQVRGLLTYFPFQNDKEQKPHFRAEDQTVVDQDETAVNPILVFWQNRLVPHDLVKDLPILRQTSSALKDSITEFRHRCCGILFFPHDMKIERNKMNLSVNDGVNDAGSLSEALEERTNDRRGGNFKWERRLMGGKKDSALGWLRTMHEKYDEEIRFEKPSDCNSQEQVTHVANWVSRVDGMKRLRTDSVVFTKFEKATFSSGKKVTISVGSKVKIKAQQVWFGVVREIVAMGRKSDGYRGQGWFRLERHPPEIYPADKKEGLSFPMSRVGPGFDQNGLVQDKEWDKEMNKRSSQLPHSIRLFHWSNDFKKPGAPINSTPKNKPMEIVVGDAAKMRKELDFAVQVFSAKRGAKPMSSITKENRLKVVMVITAESTHETTDEGERALPTVNADWPEVQDNADRPEEHVADATKDSENQFFFGSKTNKKEHAAKHFIDKWTVAGLYTVTFRVEDSQRKGFEILNPPRVQVLMKSGRPETAYHFDCPSWTRTKPVRQIKLRNIVKEPIGFTLQDEYGNVCQIEQWGLPKVRCEVEALPAYKSKEKGSQGSQDKGSQEKDPKSIFVMKCKPKIKADDDFVLCLEDCWIDTEGKYQPAVKHFNELAEGEVEVLKGKGQFKQNKAKRLLGDIRPNNSVRYRAIRIRVHLTFRGFEIACDDVFSANLLPGEPTSFTIQALDEYKAASSTQRVVVGRHGEQEKDIKVVTVENGSRIPAFNVQLVDHLGIAVFPSNRQQVLVRLVMHPDDNVLKDVGEGATLWKTSTTKDCSGSGQFHFNNVVVEAPSKDLFGKALHIGLNVKGGGPTLDGKGATDMVTILVTPSHRPARLQVWRRPEAGASSQKEVLVGGESGDEVFDEAVGTKITNFFVKVLDEAGEIVEIPSNTEIVSSWAMPSGRGKKAWRSSGDLPPLTLPTKPKWNDDHTYIEDYEVRVKGLKDAKQQLLETTFTINVEPEAATQWKIAADGPGGSVPPIKCGAKGELAKVLEVFAADKYGNRARYAEGVDDETPLPDPILEVAGEDGKPVTLVPSIASRLKQRRSKGGSIVVDRSPIHEVGKAVQLSGKACTCVLSVRDEQEGPGHLESGQSSKAKVKVIAGDAEKILLASDIIQKDDEPEEAEHSDPPDFPFPSIPEAEEGGKQVTYRAEVPRLHRLRDLRAFIVDCGHNIVADDPMPLTLRDHLGGVNITPAAAHKMRTKEGIALFKESKLAANDGTSDYTLRVEGAQKLKKFAEIKCKVVLGNGVTKMSHGCTVTTAVAGQPLNIAFKLTLATEDGAAFVPDVDAFDITLKKLQKPKHKDVDAVITAVEGGARVESWTAEGEPFVPKESGQYQIKYAFRDSRPGMDGQMHKGKFDFTVDPGPADRLVPKKKIADVNATNAPDPRFRLLFKSQQILAEDVYGNKAAIPEGAVLRAKLAAAVGGGGELVDASKWPRLMVGGSPVDAAAGTECKIERTSNVDYARSGDLSLQERVGEAEGRYEIRFELSHPTLRNVAPLVVSVNFTPDGKHAEEIAEATRKRAELEAKVEELMAEKAEAGDAFKAHIDELQRLSKKMKELLRAMRSSEQVPWAVEMLKKYGYRDDGSKPDEPEERKMFTVKSAETIAELALKVLNENKRKARPAKMRTINNEAATRQLGFPVVEAGFVADEKMAEILSWIAGQSNMRAFVAYDADKQAQLYKRKISAFSMDTFDSTYLVRGAGGARQRNDAERAEGKLPHALPISHADGRWPHHLKEPLFAVNLIELPPDKEDLRDSLFHRIYGQTLIMDTLGGEGGATAYRKACKRYGRRAGNIYTLDGHCNQSGGMLDPNMRPPNRPEFVFGSMPFGGGIGAQVQDLKKAALGTSL